MGGDVAFWEEDLSFATVRKLRRAAIGFKVGPPVASKVNTSMSPRRDQLRKGLI
jgi:hypothetical protein